MIVDTNAPHSSATFWLDVADRVIKLLALLVGAVWTWMHYQRSRTYAQKLELELVGRVFLRDRLFLETVAGLQNVGASEHVFVAREARSRSGQ